MEIEIEKETGIEKVVAKAGGQTALANKVAKLTGRNVKQGHVYHWLKIGHVPELYRRAVALSVNNEVPLEELTNIIPLKQAANG